MVPRPASSIAACTATWRSPAGGSPKTACAAATTDGRGHRTVIARTFRASCADCETYKAFKVKSYTTVEKQGFVWIWLGDGPTVGEPIDFPRFADRGWHHWVMEREFPGNAFHCVENFLDVPHTAHVHRGLFRGKESKNVELEITSGKDWIQAEFLNEERMESIIGRNACPEGGANRAHRSLPAALRHTRRLPHDGEAPVHRHEPVHAGLRERDPRVHLHGLPLRTARPVGAAGLRTALTTSSSTRM